ncbi:RloB-like protein [Desulfobotulus alkaliphilus]|uniref:RloB-like protein n=1 Tax=Desulfobotulus alkaliphilus TaxID=622671 RepID=A0A562R9Q4_9BACT|nr:RloB family protein [Desulfobotulus alkaliphilus]TWI65755.1 RloB-like protein [Desulfobotulus alkaliphilus]
MGTDDLHHKRKERRLSSLARERANRAPYERVLIVCEGEKTEPAYFEAMRKDLRLSSANIRVTGDSGSAPISVVNYGLEHHKNYDRVFCVFDKDRHGSYQPALDRLKGKKLPKIRAIVSAPCFEFWLLLHFEKTTRNFDTKGSGSICENVIAALRKPRLYPGYAKGRGDACSHLKDRLPQAMKNAREVLAHCERSQSWETFTEVHLLVDYLQNLKK